MGFGDDRIGLLQESCTEVPDLLIRNTFDAVAYAHYVSKRMAQKRSPDNRRWRNRSTLATYDGVVYLRGIMW